MLDKYTKKIIIGMIFLFVFSVIASFIFAINVNYPACCCFDEGIFFTVSGDTAYRVCRRRF